MKKIFIFSILLFFIGCSQKETTLTLPIKGYKKNFHCKNITVNSNNKLLMQLLNEEKPNILLTHKGINCNIYIKNITNKKIFYYKKNIEIIYDKKHPKCIYLKQSCILKGNYYFCSNPQKISYNEFNKIKHFKYRYKNFYLENPNSNIFYKIKIKCNPSFITIKCKKENLKIKNIYFLNKRIIFTQNNTYFIDSCENIDNEIFFEDINFIKNYITNIDNKIKSKSFFIYKNLIKNFVNNFFPHISKINFKILKPDVKNDEIEEIYDKLVNNKKVTKTDLIKTKLYSKKILKEKDIKNYIILKTMEITIMLKLNYINSISKEKEVINEINRLLFLSKRTKNDKLIKVLKRLKRLIYKIFINK